MATGAFLFFITKSVLYRLQLVQDLTIVTEGHPEGHEVGQETEEGKKWLENGACRPLLNLNSFKA